MDIDVEKVARAARLKLSDAEKKELERELSKVLAHFSELDKAKLSERIAVQPTELRDVMRDDIPSPSLDITEVFKNTKNKQGNYFKGPSAL